MLHALTLRDAVTLGTGQESGWRWTSETGSLVVGSEYSARSVVTGRSGLSLRGAVVSTHSAGPWGRTQGAGSLVYVGGYEGGGHTVVSTSAGTALSDVSDGSGWPKSDRGARGPYALRRRVEGRQNSGNWWLAWPVVARSAHMRDASTGHRGVSWGCLPRTLFVRTRGETRVASYGFER